MVILDDDEVKEFSPTMVSGLLKVWAKGFVIYVLRTESSSSFLADDETVLFVIPRWIHNQGCEDIAHAWAEGFDHRLETWLRQRNE